MVDEEILGEYHKMERQFEENIKLSDSWIGILLGIFLIVLSLFDVKGLDFIPSKWMLYIGIFFLSVSLIAYLLYKVENRRLLKKYRGKFTLSLKKNF